MYNKRGNHLPIGPISRPKNGGKTMKLKSVELGIHTIELYAGKLKYQEVQKVADYLVERGSIQQSWSDPYNIDRQLKSHVFVDRGVNLRIHQSHNKSNGISFALNPSTVLST